MKTMAVGGRVQNKPLKYEPFLVTIEAGAYM